MECLLCSSEPEEGTSNYPHPRPSWDPAEMALWGPSGLDSIEREDLARRLSDP